ncbi:acetoacetate--CoA ligase [Alphaproteobacteria bacterium]|nr:acetoacetate--CoA ligase [Alphaproteobacteria bacterium]
MKALWKPNDSFIKKTNIFNFQRFLEKDQKKKFANYDKLWKWSIKNKEIFWTKLADYFNIAVYKEKNFISYKKNKKFTDCVFFKNSKINYYNEIDKLKPNNIAIKFFSENNYSNQLTYNDLYRKVNSLALYFKDKKLKKGDRVVGYLPNTPDTIICFLACAKLGLVWSSCSPDFGVKAVIDRFHQLKPKVLIISDYYIYNGKKFNYSNQLSKIQNTLKIPHILKTAYPSPSSKKQDLQKIYRKYQNAIFLKNNFFSFDHPLYVLFSSGTTGLPKCITHSHGGVILQHIKELSLHTNVSSKDNMLFFTTCGWMMWNWLVSNLLLGATISLYEGSPFYPSAKNFINVIKKSEATILGAGAKAFEHLYTSQLSKKNTYIKNLKSIISTGSPLSEDMFNFINKKINKNIPIHSISGGTDIVSSFMLGNPIKPVYKGEIQSPGLGMDIDVFDEKGFPTNKTGELVCKSPFPSKPIYFWNDKNNKKYQSAYFIKYKNIWSHGDFVQKTINGGYRVYGRSDATLNPGGVRIGTAEIYNILNSLVFIDDTLAVGYKDKNDEKIILFIKSNSNSKITIKQIMNLKKLIKNQLSPRHVPWKCIQVKDIPRTKSGKNSEIIVKKILNNDRVTNLDALANPESLKEYKSIKIYE